MSDDSNLRVPDDDDCAFCAYLAGTRPYTILWREQKVAVLVTREQRGIAHLLVLPVRHESTLLDLRVVDAAPLMVAIRDAASAIDRAFERPGIAVWQNNGLPANQRIGHLHFHVAGTIPGGGTDFGEVPELSIAETDRIAVQLAPYVRQPRGAKRRVFT